MRSISLFKWFRCSDPQRRLYICDSVKRSVDVEQCHRSERNMSMTDREKIAREIKKISNSIRKKSRALKTGKMKEEVALVRHFKPIIEPLKRLVEKTADVSTDIELSNVAKIETLEKPKTESTRKRKISNEWLTDSSITFSPKQPKSMDPPIDTIVLPRQEQPSLFIEEEVFQTAPENSLATSVQRELQTSEGQRTLRSHLGPLGQEYMDAVFSRDQNRAVDYVYGVRFSDEGKTMLGDKRFDMDKNDNIYVDGIKYAGTPGLYELIFKRIPDEALYDTEDLQKYKNILMRTSAHKRGHNELNPILSNKGYKYKHVIAPLVGKRSGKGIPYIMTPIDNKIDYVYWDDPNELVDRLRLLEASRQAGNSAHGNEILSIIEELREDGLIIN